MITAVGIVPGALAGGPPSPFRFFHRRKRTDRRHRTRARKRPRQVASQASPALLHAHEIVLKEARTMARRAAEGGDDGTNDLLVSDVIRRNELQVWFVAEHVVDVH
jgi:hypothetical protein